jgi:hypothetical protein
MPRAQSALRLTRLLDMPAVQLDHRACAAGRQAGPIQSIDDVSSASTAMFWVWPACLSVAHVRWSSCTLGISSSLVRRRRALC